MANRQAPRRPNKAVYRRRRLVVLVLLLSLLVGVGFAVKAAISYVSGKLVAQRESSALADISKRVTSSGFGAEETQVTTCDPAEITTVFTAENSSVATSGNANFRLEFTNSSRQSCLMNFVSPDWELLVTSGSDRIWSSADCERTGFEARQLLIPVDGTDVQVFSWRVQRSEPGCGSVSAAPQAGSYRAELLWQEETVGEVGFSLH